MARFVGSFSHTLDTKRRLILPSKYREAFKPKAYLSPNSGPCLGLWTWDEFNAQIEEKIAQARQSMEAANLVRAWSAESCEVDVDTQGRIAIPAKLLTYAGLDSEVLVVGALDKVELWSPSLWESVVTPYQEQLGAGFMTLARNGPGDG